MKHECKNKIILEKRQKLIERMADSLDALNSNTQAIKSAIAPTSCDGIKITPQEYDEIIASYLGMFNTIFHSLEDLSEYMFGEGEKKRIYEVFKDIITVHAVK